MSKKDFDVSVEPQTYRSSADPSSDELPESTITSTSDPIEDTISICSLQSYNHIPEEISKGAAYTLEKMCINPGCFRTGKEVLPRVFSALDWEQKLEGFRQKILTETSIAEIHLRFSDIFKERLQDIEGKASCDLEVKLQMYRDWVIILTKFNENVFEDVRNLENAVSELQHATRAYSLLSSSRRDLSTLVQLIGCAFYHRKWSLAGIELETLDLAEVMGLNRSNPRHARILFDLIKGKPHNS